MLGTECKHPADSANGLNMSDKQLIARVRGGDISAYAHIMRRYNQRLFRTARSMLHDNDSAEDAVQQAYITAYYKLDSYQFTGSFGAWLSRITINEALMIMRKPDNKLVTAVDMKTISMTGTAANGSTHTHTQTDTTADALANEELAILIEQAIAQLPLEFRQVFVLRAVQQLSVRETADSLDIGEATVKTRFLRARERIQEKLNLHIQQAGLHAYEFAGQRCDNIVQSVLHHIARQ